MIYSTAARIMLALAVNPDGTVHIGAPDNPMRRIFRVAAEACQRVEQAQADRDAAVLFVAELCSLLDQTADLLEARPLPMEGGTWDSYMVAHKARMLLESEPLTAGRALRDELHAARVVARAATALVAARQERSPERIRVCEEALQQAVAALKEPFNSGPNGTG